MSLNPNQERENTTKPFLKHTLFSENPIYREWSHSILRIFFGLSLVYHGLDKLLQFSTYMNDFPDPLGVGDTMSLILAIFSEFFCGLLIIAGLFTRLAAVIVLFTFIVIVFVYHSADPYLVRELGVFFLVLSGYFLFSGAGKLSLDRKFFAL